VTHPGFTRQDWRALLDNLAPFNRLGTAQGFGYAAAVEPGWPDPTRRYLADYRIERSRWPASTGKAAFPIVILEPNDARNRAALGFDMYSEPVRHAAIDRAAQTNKASASGIVRLKQEVAGEVQNGFLIYMPVRDSMGRLNGFVYAPYRVEDFFRGTGRSLINLGYGLEVRDPKGETVFHTGPSEGHRYRTTLAVADQRWPVMIVMPRPWASASSLWLIALGLIMAAGLAAIIIQNRRRLAAVEALGKEKDSHSAETQLLMREMAHRVKNAFARISAMAALTGRESKTKEEFLTRFNNRLQALARNKEMLISGAQEGGHLHDLVIKELEIAAVADPESLVSGDDFEVPADEYWAVALCVHELITNSIKYGALAGRGSLACEIKRVDRHRQIVWRELLDRDISVGNEGFGTGFVETLVTRQLKGTIERVIQGRELTATLEWPAPEEAKASS